MKIMFPPKHKQYGSEPQCHLGGRGQGWVNVLRAVERQFPSVFWLISLVVGQQVSLLYTSARGEKIKLPSLSVYYRYTSVCSWYIVVQLSIYSNPINRINCKICMGMSGGNPDIPSLTTLVVTYVLIHFLIFRLIFSEPNFPPPNFEGLSGPLTQ